MYRRFVRRDSLHCTKVSPTHSPPTTLSHSASTKRYPSTPQCVDLMCTAHLGMASPLVGIAGVNSLLFASYGASKRIISPFPNLSLKEIAAAGAMAGAANAILASPGAFILSFVSPSQYRFDSTPSHLFVSTIILIDACGIVCV